MRVCFDSAPYSSCVVVTLGATWAHDTEGIANGIRGAGAGWGVDRLRGDESGRAEYCREGKRDGDKDTRGCRQAGVQVEVKHTYQAVGSGCLSPKMARCRLRLPAGKCTVLSPLPAAASADLCSSTRSGGRAIAADILLSKLLGQRVAARRTGLQGGGACWVHEARQREATQGAQRHAAQAASPCTFAQSCSPLHTSWPHPASPGSRLPT